MCLLFEQAGAWRLLSPQKSREKSSPKSNSHQVLTGGCDTPWGAATVSTNGKRTPEGLNTKISGVMSSQSLLLPCDMEEFSCSTRVEGREDEVLKEINISEVIPIAASYCEVFRKL